MKVLLHQAVKNVGVPGDIKDVASGFARNYLIPRGMASAATVGVLREAEAQRAAEARRDAKNVAENEALAARVGSTTIRLTARVGEQHRLYGAITSADIATRLAEEIGQEIDRRRIELDEPIRQLGEYKVPVRLARDVVPQLTVVVEGEA